MRPGWSHTATRAARTARGGARFSTEARRQIKVDAAVARQEPRGGAPSDARDRSRGGRPARRWRELWRGPSLVLQGTAGGLEPAMATACLHAWLLAACSLQKPANSHTPASVQARRLRRRSRRSPREARGLRVGIRVIKRVPTGRICNQQLVELTCLPRGKLSFATTLRKEARLSRVS